MYQWFSDALAREFQEEQLLKRSSRGSVQLLRHKGSGQRFVLRRFRGNAEVYRQLLRCTCKNLPEIFETASREDLAATEEIVWGLAMVEIQLLDHVIVTETEYCSLRQENRMPLYDVHSGQVLLASRSPRRPQK